MADACAALDVDVWFISESWGWMGYVRRDGAQFCGHHAAQMASREARITALSARRIWVRTEWPLEAMTDAALQARFDAAVSKLPVAAPPPPESPRW